MPALEVFMKRLSALCALCAALALASCATKSGGTVSADDAIKGVSVIGTIGMDGSKPRDISTKGGVITAGTHEIGNYYQYEYIGIDPQTGGTRESEYYNYAREGTYTISEIAGYELHMTERDREQHPEAKAAFRATHCFDEANGEYWDFELPYALYVPADYDPSKKYALVLHLHDAGSMDSNPMLTLCESQGAANYASPYFRELLRAQGLDGAIVVCPAISEDFYMDDAPLPTEILSARPTACTSGRKSATALRYTFPRESAEAAPSATIPAAPSSAATKCFCRGDRA